MRLVAALAVALLLPVPFAASDREDEPRPSLDVMLIDAHGVGVLVAWTPDPLAAEYYVYRGESRNSVVLIETTSDTHFLDHGAPSTGSVWYVIVSKAIPLNNSVPEAGRGMKGECVSQRDSSTSVTFRNCTPQGV